MKYSYIFIILKLLMKDHCVFCDVRRKFLNIMWVWKYFRIQKRKI